MIRLATYMHLGQPAPVPVSSHCGIVGAASGHQANRRVNAIVCWYSWLSMAKVLRLTGSFAQLESFALESPAAIFFTAVKKAVLVLLAPAGSGGGLLPGWRRIAGAGKWTAAARVSESAGSLSAKPNANSRPAASCLNPHTRTHRKLHSARRGGQSQLRWAKEACLERRARSAAAKKLDATCPIARRLVAPRAPGAQPSVCRVDWSRVREADDTNQCRAYRRKPHHPAQPHPQHRMHLRLQRCRTSSIYPAPDTFLGLPRLWDRLTARRPPQTPTVQFQHTSARLLPQLGPFRQPGFSMYLASATRCCKRQSMPTLPPQAISTLRSSSTTFDAAAAHTLRLSSPVRPTT